MAEATPKLDVHRGTDDGVQLLGHRLDYRPVTHIGLGALGADQAMVPPSAPQSPLVSP